MDTAIARNLKRGYYDSFVPDLDGLSALLNAVRTHSTLKHIDLRGNFLNVAAGRLLSEAALANAKLQSPSMFTRMGRGNWAFFAGQGWGLQPPGGLDVHSRITQPRRLNSDLPLRVQPRVA